MSEHYDVAVLIGRFQPPHISHKAIIDRARAKADNVIVFVGSANRARSQRNPFEDIERIEMCKLMFGTHKIQYFPLNDDDYAMNDWVESVRSKVYEFTGSRVLRVPPSVALMGTEKDASSWYLRFFPDWKRIEVDADILHATDLRADLFRWGKEDYQDPVDAVHTLTAKQWEGKTDSSVIAYMHDWLDENFQTYKRLSAEWLHCINYPAIYGEGPHLTADSFVTQAGHVLLVTRGGPYGKGLLALPGGFINKTERLKEAALRELREETKIDVPPTMLEQSIRGSERFEEPLRDERARMITEVFHFDLQGDINKQIAAGKDQVRLTKVKGSDDAIDARWYPFEFVEQNPKMLFADHYFIIKRMKDLMKV